MEDIFLFLHIIGAGVVGAFIIFAMGDLLRRQATYYVLYAKSIAVGGAYELITGSLLAVTLHSTVFAFCARIGAYLGIILLSEIVLVIAMKKVPEAFPAFHVISSLSVGMVVVLLTIVSQVVP